MRRLEGVAPGSMCCGRPKSVKCVVMANQVSKYSRAQNTKINFKMNTKMPQEVKAETERPKARRPISKWPTKCYRVTVDQKQADK